MLYMLYVVVRVVLYADGGVLMLCIYAPCGSTSDTIYWRWDDDGVCVYTSDQYEL